MQAESEDSEDDLEGAGVGVGLMSALQPDVRFFEECVHTPRRKLPEYEGRSLKWGERTLLNCNDPGHIQKALCRDVRQRCLNFVVQGYYIYMSRGAQLLGGLLPVQSYQAKDDQSDVEASWALSPVKVPVSWDGIAVLLWQLLA